MFRIVLKSGASNWCCHFIAFNKLNVILHILIEVQLESDERFKANPSQTSPDVVANSLSILNEGHPLPLANIETLYRFNEKGDSALWRAGALMALCHSANTMGLKLATKVLLKREQAINSSIDSYGYRWRCYVLSQAIWLEPPP
ncbi:hypothetical protein CDAR_563311 [Caerostris darwini]|uniref:Vitellogenin n=1 Tax=Caerostris darwini TaxID=1538125 RepID=A0AAV4UVZ4_9ARAC|nr:hypothetical protein CDAR_563311 [Caerostris darwini]